MSEILVLLNNLSMLVLMRLKKVCKSNKPEFLNKVYFIVIFTVYNVYIIAIVILVCRNVPQPLPLVGLH